MKTGRVLYHWFRVTPLLIAAGLLSADPIALRPGVLTGLLAGGLYALGDRDVPFIRLMALAWICAAVVDLIVTHTAIDVLRGGLILIVVVVAARRVEAWGAVPVVWCAGMILSALLPDALALGPPLAAVALLFWLMHRTGDVAPGWIDDGLRITAPLLLIAGGLLTLNPPALPALILAPLAWTLVAARAHYALIHPNSGRTLGAYWLALGVLLLLIGAGALGGLAAIPGLWARVEPTRWRDAWEWLLLWGALAIAFGTINQAAASLRGVNRRVTGLLPYWTIAFGVGFGAMTLAITGTVEVVAPSAPEIAPLRDAWALIRGATLAGVLIYALGLLVRGVLSRDC